MLYPYTHLDFIIIILFLTCFECSLNVSALCELEKKTLYTYSFSWLINTFISCCYTWNSISKASGPPSPPASPRTTCFLGKLASFQFLLPAKSFSISGLSPAIVCPLLAQYHRATSSKRTAPAANLSRLLIVPSRGPP